MKNHIPLTAEEEIHYANESSIEMCDDIGHNDWVPLRNDVENPDGNYMIFDGLFICRNCRI